MVFEAGVWSPCPHVRLSSPQTLCYRNSRAAVCVTLVIPHLRRDVASSRTRFAPPRLTRFRLPFEDVFLSFFAAVWFFFAPYIETKKNRPFSYFRLTCQLRVFPLRKIVKNQLNSMCFFQRGVSMNFFFHDHRQPREPPAPGLRAPSSPRSGHTHTHKL